MVLADFPFLKYVEMAPEDGMHVFFAGGVASHELANLGAVQVQKKSLDVDGFNAVVRSFTGYEPGQKPPRTVKKKVFECARAAGQSGVPKRRGLRRR